MESILPDIQVTLSLFTLGVAALLQADAVIFGSSRGLVFSIASDMSEKHVEERVQEAVSMLFTLPMFVILGVALPWGAGIQLIAVAAVLLRRRFPGFTNAGTNPGCPWQSLSSSRGEFSTSEHP